MAAAEVKRAVLFGAAPCASWRFLEAYLTGEEVVICADGGVNHARAAGLTPHYLVGDWDSGGHPEEGIPAISLPVEKNETDLQAAAQLACDLSCQELLLCGCTGGRLDHTAANLLLLELVGARGVSALLVDEDNEARFSAGGTVTVPNSPAYRYLSIVPLDARVEGVTLRGLKYPLTDAVLARGDTLSMSNEPLEEPCVITTGSGRILIIRSKRQ